MSYPTCENCQKSAATVTVIEIHPRAEGEKTSSVRQQQLCEDCAQRKDLPHAPVPKKGIGDIWKLLQTSGQLAKAKEKSDIQCPDCGMSREELRNRGRIGCARDYEIFASDITEILERVHGSTRHEGRIPGVSSEELERMQAITSLKRDLMEAIRKEAYENAARIRDELHALGEGA